MTERDRIIALRIEASERHGRGEINDAAFHRILAENPVPRAGHDDTPAERLMATSLKGVNGGLARLNQWLKEKQR